MKLLRWVKRLLRPEPARPESLGAAKRQYEQRILDDAREMNRHRRFGKPYGSRR